MKNETAEQKLNRMLGLAEKAVEVKARSTGKLVGVTEEEIQEFREAQGLIYFLKAPELFTFKICPHCEGEFFVSRKYVAFCSYTCISKSLEEVTGVKWHKGMDIEGLVQSPIYEGNEPIWLTDRLLKKLREMVSGLPSNLDESALPNSLEISVHHPLPEVETPAVVSKSDALAALGLGPTSKSSTKGITSSSSVNTTTTTSPTSGKTTSKTRGKSRRVISSN